MTRVEETLRERCYAAVAPLAFGAAWCAARAFGATPDALRERRGVLPAATSPLLWFHGASAGEIAAAAKLAHALREAGLGFTAGFTATNRAGVEMAGRVGGAGDVRALVPWDTPRWVARAFDAWQPAALLLVETELWPRLVLEAHRRDVPVLCVSARIYPRDIARYRAIRRWIAPTLRRLDAVLAQDACERERFLALGAPAERCVAAGNLKHLGTGTPDTSLRAELGLRPDEAVVVVGSVHEDEVPAIVTALEAVRAVPCRVIVAPRHAGAGSAVARAAARRGWSTARRSRLGAPLDWRLLVLDTMGELPRAYVIAAVAVVGGSFTRHGGHNPLEPVACGAPVLFGPHVEHFATAAAALVTAVPEAQVRDGRHLGRRLAEWLASGERRARILARQRAALPDGARVAARYRALLLPRLEGRCTWQGPNGVARSA